MSVPGPDQTTWWDVDDVVAKVKHQFRLRPAPAPDLDDERWVELVGVAGEMINTHLDRRTPPVGTVPDSWHRAVVALVVELADSGVPMSDGSVSSYQSGDPMQAVVPLLRGHRSRFGVA